MTRANHVPLLSSIAPLAADYDAWICDIWGVLHNGVRAFDAAAQACRSFRAAGGLVLLLSNAPRPAEAAQQQLDRLGVPRDAYNAILTSGDLTRALLGQQLDKSLLHVGPERDTPIFAGLGLRFAAEENADLIVCSGLFDDERETPDDYRATFTRLVRRQVPMLCANPDLTVERGSRLVYCAGALAALYEDLGGRVTYAGKPHRPVYDLAFERIDGLRGCTVLRDRILAIGDVIRTDIQGAANAGLSSLFIASAIHVDGPLDSDKLDQLFGTSQVRPIAALAALAW